jgi:hypothetical protein
MSNWLDNIEERIVDAYKTKGLRVRQHTFASTDGDCCGLAALYGADKDGDTWIERWAKLAGTDNDGIWSFIRGFDGCAIDLPFDGHPFVMNTEAFEAGKRSYACAKGAGL